MDKSSGRLFEGLNHGEKKIEVIESSNKQTVFLRGRPYMSWSNEDESAPRMAIAQLYELGLVTQEELADAFQVHIKSVYNYINAYEADGVRGLISQPRGPKQKWKITPQTKAKILFAVLKEDLTEYDAIQENLEKVWKEEISIASIRQVLIENGLIQEHIKIASPEKQRSFFEGFTEKESQQLEFSFPWSEGSQEKTNAEEMEEIKERGKRNLTFSETQIDLKRKKRSQYSQAERMYLDLLERGEYSAYAGGLLYLPLLQRHNFLPLIEKVIKIDKKNDYTLSQLCLTLFYYNIFNFRSIENFKTAYPEEFGPLIGKITSPSIYTLRRFLEEIQRLKQGERLIEEFAKWYLKSKIAEWGIMYIDEHFVPYYGKELISMGYFTVRNIPLKGSYHFFVTDENFNPLLFLLRPSSEDLIPRIPEIIKKIRKIAQEAGVKEEEVRDLTVVFDRGAYSAELFRLLDEGHKELEEEKEEAIKVKFITWAKYADKWVDKLEEEDFTQSTKIKYEVQKPEEVKYFEDEKRMSKYGMIRTIVIQSGRKKKRTAIYTNAPEEVTAEEIIRLMCRRWGEEDFIKALKLNYLIDYSPGFVTEEIEQQPLVDNPEVIKLTQKKASLAAKLQRLKAEIGDKVLDMGEKVNWQKLKEKHPKLFAEVIGSDAEKLLIQQKIDQLPKEMAFDETHEGRRLVKFNYERKRFLDCIKVFAYAMDKKMCEILVNYHDREDVWPTLAMIVRRGGFVKLAGGKLYVRLRGFKNPVINYAARHLCEGLNKMRPVTLDKFHFPVHYEVT
jgi:transposase